MRVPPARIPEKLPSITTAAAAIEKEVRRPRVELADMSLRALITDDLGRIWLTGSTVWSRAVFGVGFTDSDVDLLFENQSHCETFARRTVDLLNSRIGKVRSGEFSIKANKFGSPRIVHPDGRNLIDCWWLEGDQTIHEALLAFPGGDHIHCAYEISHDRMMHPDLIRMVTVPGTVRHDAFVQANPGLLRKRKTNSDSVDVEQTSMFDRIATAVHKDPAGYGW